MRILESGDPDEISDMQIALQVGEALNKHYPNHPWVVGFQGRGLVIRHLSIASEIMRVIGKEGFAACLPREKLGTPKEIERTAVEFGGRLLEAFGLPRGSWDGSLPIVPREWVYGQQRFH